MTHCREIADENRHQFLFTIIFTVCSVRRRKGIPKTWKHGRSYQKQYRLSWALAPIEISSDDYITCQSRELASRNNNTTINKMLRRINVHEGTLLLAHLMGQYCFARWRLLSVVVVCWRRLSSSVTRPARGQSSGRHCTAGQYSYVPLRRHLVIIP